MNLKYILSAAALSAASLWAADSIKLPAYHNPTPGEFPILGWYSIPDSALNAERFREMREAGFNLSFSHVWGVEGNCAAAEAARGTGVRIVAGCPLLETETEKTMERLGKYPEIAAWFLRDEPVKVHFEQLAKFRDNVYAADSSRLVYLNLLPAMVEPKTLGTASYDDYLREFVKDIRLPMISYDMYPVHANATDEPNLSPMLFTNLESAKRVSQEFGIPFWAFVLSTAHDPYPIPRDSHLAVEAFSALAYGAQCIQYFTYWQPVSERWNFHHAPIDKDGKRTDVWYMARDLNREIQALAPVFLGCESIGVWHTGENIPDGTQRLETLPSPFESISYDGDGVLVSHFRNNGKNYLMLVNRNLVQAQRVDLALDKSKNAKSAVKSIRQILPDGKDAKIAATDFTIPPGRYLLLSWK